MHIMKRVFERFMKELEALAPESHDIFPTPTCDDLKRTHMEQYTTRAAKTKFDGSEGGKKMIDHWCSELKSKMQGQIDARENIHSKRAKKGDKAFYITVGSTIVALINPLQIDTWIQSHLMMSSIIASVFVILGYVKHTQDKNIKPYRVDAGCVSFAQIGWERLRDTIGAARRLMSNVAGAANVLGAAADKRNPRKED